MPIDDPIYRIKPGYVSRPANNKGFFSPDAERAQLNVYRYAHKLARGMSPKIETVLDWGCGTGGKLVRVFGHLQTLGVDVPECIARVKKKRPDREWCSPPVSIVADLVLCVDVIEHLDDPRDLLKQIKEGDWRLLVISTPERDRVRGKRSMGPPTNRWHVREWNRSEFKAFLQQELGVQPRTVVLGRWNLVARVER